MEFSSGIHLFSLSVAGLFSRSRLRGMQGTRPHATVQVWVPAGLRGACSGRSKSRNLASNDGIALRPARANQARANPHNVIFFVFHISAVDFEVL